MDKEPFMRKYKQLSKFITYLHGKDDGKWRAKRLIEKICLEYKRMISREEVQIAPNLITGTISIRKQRVEALFDLRAIQWFMSYDCVQKMDLPVHELPYIVKVSAPFRLLNKTSKVCKRVELCFKGKTLVIDLILILIQGLDMIIGMDWLVRNNVTLDYARKIVLLLVHMTPIVISTTTANQLKLSVVQVERLVFEGYQAYAVFFMVEGSGNSNIDEIQVISKFSKVFVDEVSGLSLKQEVEFSIDLALGIELISKALCRMTPSELIELKK
ncbi:uncharacterized protein LOC129322477 [Prosopis cineraria]|uniref:uncharacterized protein LOC129322477 n=1 Tax=Prosopis cineraria TaxID=364024 RepID=UPI00240FB6FD|nr:uncharacterized protein LOC129322477 [Prosopis cineraria]